MRLAMGGNRHRLQVLFVAAGLLAGLLSWSAPAEAAGAGLDVRVSLVGPQYVPVSSNVEFDITVRSTGDSVATNAVLEVFGGLTLVSYETTQGASVTCTDGSPVVCPLGSLAPAAVVELRFVYQLPPTPGRFSLYSTVTADNAFGESNFEDPTRVAGGGVDVVPVATHTPTGTVPAGSPFTFRSGVGNLGADPAPDGQLMFTIPAGLSYGGYSVVSGTATCTESAGEVSCVTGAVPGFGAVVIEFPFTAPSNEGSVVFVDVAVATSVSENSPIYSPDGFDNNSSNYQVAIGPALGVADLRASLAMVPPMFPPQIAPAEPLRYRAAVTNRGGSEATNVVLSHTLAPGASFESLAVESGSGICEEAGGVVTCSIASLPRDATFAVLVDVTAPSAPGPASSAVSVDADQPDPNSANNSASSTVTILDVDTVISIGDAAAYEGDGGTKTLIKFPVTLTEPVTQPVTVRYQIQNQFGTAGDADIDDRSLKLGTVTFKPSAKTGLTPVSKMVTVSVRPDQFAEGDENFTVQLTSPTGRAAIGDGTATGTVLDDDPGSGQRVGIGRATVREGDAGKPKVSVVLTLSQPAIDPVSVRVTVGGGDALPGTDYKAMNKTVTFKPGQQTRFVSVALYPDLVDDGDRTIELSLSNVTGASIQGSGIGTITILDDD